MCMNLLVRLNIQCQVNHHNLIHLLYIVNSMQVAMMFLTEMYLQMQKQTIKDIILLKRKNHHIRNLFSQRNLFQINLLELL